MSFNVTESNVLQYELIIFDTNREIKQTLFTRPIYLDFGWKPSMAKIVKCHKE